MKHSIALFILSLGIQLCFGQKITLLTDQEKVLNNWGNMIKLKDSSNYYDSLVLKTNNGELYQISSNQYAIKHLHFRPTVISTFAMPDSVLIQQDTFKVVDINRYKVKLSNGSGDKASKDILLRSSGLIGRFDFDCSCDIRMVVSSYVFSIKTDSAYLLRRKVLGPRFTKEIISFVRRAPAGDSIIISDIKLEKLKNATPKDIRFEID